MIQLERDADDNKKIAEDIIVEKEQLEDQVQLYEQSIAQLKNDINNIPLKLLDTKYF